MADDDFDLNRAGKDIKKPQVFDIRKLSPNTARPDSNSGYRISGSTNNPDTD